MRVSRCRTKDGTDSLTFMKGACSWHTCVLRSEVPIDVEYRTRRLTRTLDPLGLIIAFSLVCTSTQPDTTMAYVNATGRISVPVRTKDQPRTRYGRSPICGGR